MSSIYNQEPITKGKILLVTSVGDIDIELWPKEAPKACRNFVQLCMEGYYDGTVFHRLVKNFIVQGGDPTGTGTGGESIYGAPFKDEFHSRLRFVRRGLLAMANAGPNDNASQFFFTLAEAPELQNKHTIFGKITGPTLYNMLKLTEVETDAEDRPLYPHKILKTQVLANPYDDIVPRMIKKLKKDKDEDKKVKSKSKATKNFSLLSFGEEAEEDEEQTFKASKKFSGKSKSSHDLTDDPRLSTVPVVEKDRGGTKRKKEDDAATSPDVTGEEIRKKLKKENIPEVTPVKEEKELTLEEIKKNKSEEIKKEQRKIKKEMRDAKKKSEGEKAELQKQAELQKHKTDDEEKSPEKKEGKESQGSTDLLESFKQERLKFKNLKKQQSKKGQSREAQTLALLDKFKSQLSSARSLATGYSDSEGEGDEGNKEEEEEAVDETSDISWMKHKLKFIVPAGQKVLDANVDDNDRFDIIDPRNPITKRRLEASKKKSKQK